MQCPPTPGPGVWTFTLGCLLANSISSHTLTPSVSQILSISFARAMLTSLNVFSNSLHTSAVVASVVNTSASTKVLYTSLTISADFVSTPPTTLWLFFSSYKIFPGITLSGLWAKYMSSETFKPDFSSIGLTTSSVVRGGDVDSRTTVSPFLITFNMSWQASLMYFKSQLLSSLNGVPTQMIYISASWILLETSILPSSRALSRTSLSPGSSISKVPFLIFSIFSLTGSYPKTLKWSLSIVAVGKPIYPNPNTEMLLILIISS